MQDLFLDANAHLPLNPKALQAYLEFSTTLDAHGHPSSLSVPGRKAATKLEECRGKIAQLIGATKPEQIVFTSTCTQAAEWGLQLLKGVESTTPQPMMAGDHPFYSPIMSNLEHSAVYQAADQIFDDGVNRSVTRLKNNKSGKVLWKQLLLPEHKKAKVICVHLQNELGTIQPITEIKSTCQYLFSDLSQSLGKLPVDVQKLDVDFAIFAAHKFGGPGSLGILYLKNPSHWRPFGTGSRYFLDRPGTPDVAAVVATTVALQESLNSLTIRTEKMQTFQSVLEQGLTERGIEILGKEEHRSPNTTFIYLPDQAARVLLELGQRNIYVGLGSACGSMHAGPSPIIKALGRAGAVQDYVRISQYGEYGVLEAKYFLTILDQIL